MNVRKILSFVVLVAILGASLVGCSTPAEEPAAEAESTPEVAAEPYEIAVVVVRVSDCLSRRVLVNELVI